MPAILRRDRRESLVSGSRGRLVAMGLMLVKLAGALSVLRRRSSSRKTISNTQCRLFSTAQWLRTIGPSLSAGRFRELIWKRVSRSVLLPISRMLSMMTTVFSPGHLWRSRNQPISWMTVASRVSIRP